MSVLWILLSYVLGGLTAFLICISLIRKLIRANALLMNESDFNFLWAKALSDNFPDKGPRNPNWLKVCITRAALMRQFDANNEAIKKKGKY